MQQVLDCFVYARVMNHVNSMEIYFNFCLRSPYQLIIKLRRNQLSIRGARELLVLADSRAIKTELIIRRKIKFSRSQFKCWSEEQRSEYFKACNESHKYWHLQTWASSVFRAQQAEICSKIFRQHQNFNWIETWALKVHQKRWSLLFHIFGFVCSNSTF